MSQILRKNVSGRRKRGILAAVMDAAAGMGKGDGTTFAVCVICGLNAYRNSPLTSPDRLELGHVVSEHNGGDYVPNNLVPQCFSCNRAIDTADSDRFVWDYDPRPFYPSRIPNVPAGTVPVTRDACDASGRGHDALVKR